MARAAELLFCAVATACAAEPGYVDPIQCRRCHQEVFDSYAKTGMGRSFGAAVDIRPMSGFLHVASQRYYSVVQRGDAWYMRREQTGPTNIIEKRIDFVVGSGNHSTTFVHRDERGRLLELPVSWYSEQGGHWAMSPGYDRSDHSDFRREISPACLFCHNGYPSATNGGLAQGIDCQRCHGPGEAHVQRRGHILNPAKLTAERRTEICLQCHLESASRSLPDAIRRFDRTPFSYRPGEPLGNFMLYFQFTDFASEDRITVNGSAYGMLRSQCFLRSSGRLTCTTCHDPHTQQNEAGYTAICQSCHTTEHTRSASNCVACHMPKRRTEDAVHVVMTDHRIRRKPLADDPLAPLEERQDRHAGPVKLLYPPNVASSAENELYLAVAQVQSAANPAAHIGRLDRAIAIARPTRAEPYVTLAEALKKTGRSPEALRAYRRAIGLNPQNTQARIGASELLSAQEAVTLLAAGLKSMPEDAAMLNALAVVNGRLGSFMEALKLLGTAVRANPDDPVSWLNTGVCLEATGDKKGAEAAYRQALLLQPDLKRAQEYLSRISKH